MFALFAGSDDPEYALSGGVNDLRAIRKTIKGAQNALDSDNDSGLDWAHAVDLDDPQLRKVSEWGRHGGPWSRDVDDIHTSRLTSRRR